MKEFNHRKWLRETGTFDESQKCFLCGDQAFRNCPECGKPVCGDDDCWDDRNGCCTKCRGTETSNRPSVKESLGDDPEVKARAKSYLSDLRWDMSQLITLLSRWKSSEAYEDDLREIRDKLKAEIDRHQGDYGL
jgi:hypothetical protein